MLLAGRAPLKTTPPTLCAPLHASLHSAPVSLRLLALRLLSLRLLALLSLGLLSPRLLSLRRLGRGRLGLSIGRSQDGGSQDERRTHKEKRTSTRQGFSHI